MFYRSFTDSEKRVILPIRGKFLAANLVVFKFLHTGEGKIEKQYTIHQRNDPAGLGKGTCG